MGVVILSQVGPACLITRNHTTFLVGLALALLSFVVI